MNKEKFVQVLKNKLNVKNIREVERALDKSGEDNKNYKDILGLTGIIRHGKKNSIEEKPKNKSINYTDLITKKNLRGDMIVYNTLTNQPMNVKNKNEKNIRLKEISKKFLTNKIGTDYFINELKKQGINTESAAVRKCIRNQEMGAPMSFSEFYVTINAHKNDKTDNIKQKKMPKKGYHYLKEDDGKDGLRHFSSKKRYSDHNSFIEDKGSFDWEYNLLDSYNKKVEESKRPLSISQKRNIHNLYNSEVFSTEDQPMKHERVRSSCKRIFSDRSEFSGSDIFSTHIPMKTESFARTRSIPKKNIESKEENTPKLRTIWTSKKTVLSRYNPFYTKPKRLTSFEE
ncbi:MAG: hypothetical protein MJ252_02700 [archaeon]|nr:hypothetical protein [archaeon]